MSALIVHEVFMESWNYPSEVSSSSKQTRLLIKTGTNTEQTCFMFKLFTGLVVKRLRLLTAARGPFEMCDDVSAKVFDKVVSQKNNE